MKRLLLGLMLATASVSFSPAEAAFSDVPSDHPNADAINYVQQEGIVEGYDDGTFRPDQTINRAEFLKIIVFALLGQEPLEHAGSCFSDVASGVWFYPYVCYANRVEIVGGYPDGSFKPANEISFVEAAKIIVIAYEYGYIDDPEIWFKGFATVLDERRAIPYSIDRLDKAITRGEMAEMVYRLRQNVRYKASRNYELLSGEVVFDGYRSRIESIDENWSRYINEDLRFQMDIPKQIDISPCLDDVREGLVVLEEYQQITLAPAHSYVFDQDCKKVRTTLEHIRSDQYYYPQWEMQFREANEEQDVHRFAWELFGDGCVIEALHESDQPGIWRVLLGPHPESMDEFACFLNFNFSFLYSPEAKMAMYVGLGQDFSFYKDSDGIEGITENDDYYDFPMIESFQFLSNQQVPTSDFSVYEQWMVPGEVITYNELNFSEDHSYGSPDCVDLENGNTGGGDLLSTLIADDNARSLMNLSVYTPQYVRDLELRIVRAADDSFFASVVCHLGNGVDVVGGSLGTENDFHAGDGTGLTLALSTPKGVHFYNDIQLYNSSATGGEVYACSGELKGSDVHWSCFMGFVDGDNDGNLYSGHTTWIIPLDGGNVEILEEVTVN